MTKQTKTALALVSIAAIAVVALFMWRGEALSGKKAATGAQAPKASTARPDSKIAASPASPSNGDRALTHAISREIQSSSDIHAAYDKYKSHPDPTGEIAFRLSLAIDNCIHFAHKSVDQLSNEMNAVGSVAHQSAPRRKEIERQIQRCKGFKEWGADAVTNIVMTLHDRAVSLGYPGAVASALPARLVNEPIERLDTEAIHLLSDKNIDGAVIKNIYNYLSQRNGEAWLSQYGDGSITAAAWALLECNYGAICDNSSPIVSFSCIYYAACDRHDVATALSVQHPSLTQERLQEAVRLVPILASQIQSRDWVRLGFSKPTVTNPKQ